MLRNGSGQSASQAHPDSDESAAGWYAFPIALHNVETGTFGTVDCESVAAGARGRDV